MSRYIRGGVIDGVACDEDELDGGERGGVFVAPGLKGVGDDVERPGSMCLHLIMEHTAQLIAVHGDRIEFQMKLRPKVSQQLPFLNVDHRLHKYYQILKKSKYTLEESCPSILPKGWKLWRLEKNIKRLASKKPAPVSKSAQVAKVVAATASKNVIKTVSKMKKQGVVQKKAAKKAAKKPEGQTLSGLVGGYGDDSSSEEEEVEEEPQKSTTTAAASSSTNNVISSKNDSAAKIAAEASSSSVPDSTTEEVSEPKKVVKPVQAGPVIVAKAQLKKSCDESKKPAGGGAEGDDDDGTAAGEEASESTAGQDAGAESEATGKFAFKPKYDFENTHAHWAEPTNGLEVTIARLLNDLGNELLHQSIDIPNRLLEEELPEDWKEEFSFLRPGGPANQYFQYIIQSVSAAMSQSSFKPPGRTKKSSNKVASTFLLKLFKWSSTAPAPKVVASSNQSGETGGAASVVDDSSKQKARRERARKLLAKKGDAAAGASTSSAPIDVETEAKEPVVIESESEAGASMSSPEPEGFFGKRIDVTDGVAYPFTSFVEVYGQEEGERRWEQSVVAPETKQVLKEKLKKEREKEAAVAKKKRDSASPGRKRSRSRSGSRDSHGSRSRSSRKKRRKSSSGTSKKTKRKRSRSRSHSHSRSEAEGQGGGDDEDEEEDVEVSDDLKASVRAMLAGLR